MLARNSALDDKILANYPELREVVKAWPDLSGSIKAAIKAVIQTQQDGD
jgi:hypothetical protein